MVNLLVINLSTITSCWNQKFDHRYGSSSLNTAVGATKQRWVGKSTSEQEFKHTHLVLYAEERSPAALTLL